MSGFAGSLVWIGTLIRAAPGNQGPDRAEKRNSFGYPTGGEGFPRPGKTDDAGSAPRPADRDPDRQLGIARKSVLVDSVGIVSPCKTSPT